MGPIPVRGLVASVLAAGVIGCGTADPEAMVDEADEVAAAGEEPTCVHIVQKYTLYDLRVFNGSQQVYTDPANANDLPYNLWCMQRISALRYRFRSLSPAHSSQYLDAYSSGNDNNVVTRSQQTDGSQEWIVYPDISGARRIQQLTTERYLDAYTTQVPGPEQRAVTRSAQQDDTQRWYIVDAGCWAECP